MKKKFNGFVEVLRPYGIVEMVRTGVVSMLRGAAPGERNGPMYATINGNGKVAVKMFS